MRGDYLSTGCKAELLEDQLEGSQLTYGIAVLHCFEYAEVLWHEFWFMTMASAMMPWQHCRRTGEEAWR
jgi:hypothetical protein